MRSARSGDIRRVNLLIVEHCTSRCEQCSTSSPLSTVRRSYQASDFFPWLDRLNQDGIRFRVISITGGEPFLHPDLGSLLDQLKERYPGKQLGVTTNFFWASEKRIAELAPKLKSLVRLVVSRYPDVVEKLGGPARFNALAPCSSGRHPG